MVGVLGCKRGLPNGSPLFLAENFLREMKNAKCRMQNADAELIILNSFSAPLPPLPLLFFFEFSIKSCIFVEDIDKQPIYE